MSYFLLHTACPRCGSSDAFAEYSDGHKWCFSCHKYVPAKIKSARQVEEILYDKKEYSKGVLPFDFTPEIPKEPYAWLKQYSLTNEEIKQNSLGWSESEGMLIFPYYEDERKENLLLWQGRYFPSRNPKVYTSGFPDDCILLHHNVSRTYPSRVVVVEDSVSAIKVSRVCDCTTLLGSNISKSKAIRLSKLYDHLTIWLDSDKLSSMVKFVEMYSILFKTIDYVYTEKDPKYYNEKEIQNALY